MGNPTGYPTATNTKKRNEIAFFSIGKGQLLKIDAESPTNTPLKVAWLGCNVRMTSMDQWERLAIASSEVSTKCTEFIGF